MRGHPGPCVVVKFQLAGTLLAASIYTSQACVIARHDPHRPRSAGTDPKTTTLPAITWRLFPHCRQVVLILAPRWDSYLATFLVIMRYRFGLPGAVRGAETGTEKAVGDDL